MSTVPSQMLRSRQLLRWLRIPCSSPVSAPLIRVSATAPRPFSCPPLNTFPLYQRHHRLYTMAAKGNYELLCLENPLLDIQGVGYVDRSS